MHILLSICTVTVMPVFNKSKIIIWELVVRPAALTDKLFRNPTPKDPNTITGKFKSLAAFKITG